MSRKAIAILGAMFILIVGTAAFLFFHKKTSNNEPTNTPANNIPVENTPVNNTPPTNNSDSTFNPAGGAIKLTDDNVVSPVLFFQGNGVTYFNKQGQLFQADLQVTSSGLAFANKRELTLPLKSGITKILWPLNGNNFIAQIDNGTSKIWSSYVSDLGEYIDLPNQISVVNWFPAGDKIIYIWVDNGKASFALANPDATGYQKISDLFQTDNDFQLSPDGKTILFYHNQTQGNVNKIYLTTPDGKIFKDVVTEGYNTGVLWAPDSRKFLFNRKDPVSSAMQLWVGDFVTGETKSLGVNTTLDKAVWFPDSQFIAAASPKLSGGSEDTMSKINVVTLAKNDVDPKIPISATDLFLSTSGNEVFFKNIQDGGLYYMSLGQ